MADIPSAIPVIPPLSGLVISLVVISLLIHKELWRVSRQPETEHNVGTTGLLRGWRRVENLLIGLLLGLFGLVLLARLISFVK